MEAELLDVLIDVQHLIEDDVYLAISNLAMSYRRLSESNLFANAGRRGRSNKFLLLQLMRETKALMIHIRSTHCV